MLRFTNKEGKVVMEAHDNGEITIHDAQLKESFDKQKKFEELKEDKKDERNE